MSSSIKQRIKTSLGGSLPGPSSHERMTSIHRRFQLNNLPDPFEPKKSGILIVLFEKEGQVHTVMIRRPTYDGVHSGQIAFPGGKMEESDIDLVDTALRETHEEIGIPPHSCEILGQLTELYIPPSNFLVQPSVAWLDNVPVFMADPEEVDEILTFPLGAFSEEAALQEREVMVKNTPLRVPCYYVMGHVIWGATAMIMTEFLDVLSASE